MADTKPTILVFCQGELEGGLKKIRENANVYQASYSEPNAPSKLLKAHPKARAIWIVDPDIATRKQKRLSKEVVEYVRNGGTYETTTVVFQSSAIGPRQFWRDGLAAAYSQKGVFLKNVDAKDSWYASPPGSVSESRVFGPVSVEAQTSVAFGKVGQGWLGWTGDIHNGDETAAAVLAMMGLNVRAKLHF
ncbi:hypothetical protein F4779DRAFT_614157 [Xylariaceae sp. FL0662B]|nr:hypothetical protein F4779DRAFT_614157 [Xylariaceae sp. FL0662B]